MAVTVRSCFWSLERVLVGLIIFALAGCSLLPDSGPSSRSIAAEATVSLLGTTPVFDYALVDINKTVLPYIADPGPGSLYRTFGTGRGPVPEITVGIGDTVSVTIFEAQAGGLFIPAEAGARAGNFVTLPNQTVDSKGYITVPYAGQIYALGRSTKAIQADIVDKLKNRAIEPQAVVALATQTSTEVSVVGEVNTPSKFPINPAGDKILDAIARAGGIKNQGYEDYVTLQRHGVKGTVYFLNLIKDPKENVFVSPGDVIYVSYYQRSFMAFGATGAGQSGQFYGAYVSAQFKFQQEVLELNEAVGKAGGLLDNRSEPGQVFVYRREDRKALARMGADLSRFPEDRELIPTIYRANFRDPSGFFAAGKFPMRDGDVLYVDNADYVEITKFLGLITTVTGSAATVASDAATIKDAAKDLRTP